jgi:peroxiredoxin
MKTFSAGLLAAALALFVLAPRPAAAAEPRKAPAWRLKGPDGNDVSSDQFKGKLVVLDFWATWCPPCIREIPGNVALQKKYADAGLVIIGVSVDEAGAGTVRRFLDKHPVNYPIVLGSWGMASGFGVTDQIPTTVIVDRDGFIRDRVVGYQAQDRLEKRLEPYLQGTAPAS